MKQTFLEALRPDVRRQIDEEGRHWVWVTLWSRDGHRIVSRAFRRRTWVLMDDEQKARVLSGDRVCEPNAYNW